MGLGDGSPASVFTLKTAGSLGTLTHTFDALGSLGNTIVVVDQSGNLKFSTFTVNSAPQALKTIMVNTVNDITDPISSTVVSLRDAINRADAAFGPVNITFNPTVFATAKTLALTSDVPELKTNDFGPIDLIGPAAGVIIKSKTLYGTNGHGEPVPYDNELFVDSGIVASISNVTFLQTGITNRGSFTLSKITITGNSVVGNGAGINNEGTLKLVDSTLSGDYAQAAYGPGGIAGGYGGAIENSGTLVIINSTFSGNSADQRGGAIDNQGVATLSDSTLSTNQTLNGASGAQGIENLNKLTLANTIVADNGDASGGSDVQGAFTSAGHNLIGKKDASTGWIVSDLTGTIAHPLNANLSTLANFGGLTPTLLPLLGSPALGAGSVSLIPAGITTDQRGLPRVVNGKVDIGAVQIQPRHPFATTPAPFGRIQAENFDLGGPGAGYYNPGNLNRGGLYRPTEGVGIGPIPASQGGGYFVGWTAQGEWLDYTANVASTGTYTLNFRVSSSPAGGTFHLNVDGKNVTGSLSLPNTGSFDVYQIVSKTGVNLTAGTHVLQLVIDTVGSIGAAGNFDWFEAVKT